MCNGGGGWRGIYWVSLEYRCKHSIEYIQRTDVSRSEQMPWQYPLAPSYLCSCLYDLLDDLRDALVSFSSARQMITCAMQSLGPISFFKTSIRSDPGAQRVRRISDPMVFSICPRLTPRKPIYLALVSLIGATDRPWYTMGDGTGPCDVGVG